MLFLDQLKWSFRHSKRQLLESILIVLAIALGVGVIVTVLSLLLAADRQFGNVGRQEYFRILRVMSSADLSSRSGAPITLLGAELAAGSWSAELEQLEELQSNLPETMHVFVENMWAGKTALLDQAEVPEELGRYPWIEANQINFLGTLPAYFGFKGFQIERGNWFLQEDLEKGSPVAVLSSGLSELLFGKEDPLGREIPLDVGDQQFNFTVIGVLAPEQQEEPGGMMFPFEQDRLAYAPVTASPYDRFGGGERKFYQFSIGVDAAADLTSAHERAQSEVRLLWGELAAVQSPLADFLQSQQNLRRYALIIGIFASVGLIIAVINILNLMLARVLKRTKSIGISIALGSSRRSVFTQFVLEASLLGVFGSFFGILFSFALVQLLRAVLGVQTMPVTAGAQISSGVVLGFVTSLLFGVYPAYLGAKTDPVDALRTD